MKALGILLLIVGLAIIGYLVFIKKSAMTVVNDIVKIGTSSKTLGDLLDVSGTSNTKKDVAIATNKLGLTYEGQSIYRTYKGVDAPSSAIGYLANGTLLTPLNTEYKNGEYKEKVNVANVTGFKLGTFLVDNTYQDVWSRREGIDLTYYPNSIGFLEDGRVVYAEIMNAGEVNEYTIYRT